MTTIVEMNTITQTEERDHQAAAFGLGAMFSVPIDQSSCANNKGRNMFNMKEVDFFTLHPFLLISGFFRREAKGVVESLSNKLYLTNLF